MSEEITKKVEDHVQADDTLQMKESQVNEVKSVMIVEPDAIAETSEPVVQENTDTVSDLSAKEESKIPDIQHKKEIDVTFPQCFFSG